MKVRLFYGLKSGNHLKKPEVVGLNDKRLCVYCWCGVRELWTSIVIFSCKVRLLAPYFFMNAIPGILPTGQASLFKNAPRVFSGNSPKEVSKKGPLRHSQIKQLICSDILADNPAFITPSSACVREVKVNVKSGKEKSQKMKEKPHFLSCHRRCSFIACACACDLQPLCRLPKIVSRQGQNHREVILSSVKPGWRIRTTWQKSRKLTG